MTKKIRVGVIFGGKSGEHEVSINSAKSIMASLDPTQYSTLPIGISKTGKWHTGPKAMHELEAAAQIPLSEPSFVQPHNSSDPVPSSETSLAPTQLPEEIDVVIPVLHGSYGEDGTIQGLLELLDIPYVGAGVLASAVGLDKIVMKQLFASVGLPQVDFTFYTRKSWQAAPESIVDDVETKLGYPCFVKPANLGSSVGISKAKNREQLREALALAASYDRKIIVEKGVDAREIEVAVLGNDEIKTSVPGEVIPSNEFYDYNAKYINGESALTIPAELPFETEREIRQLAVKAFQTIDGSGLARVDFFLERATNRLLVNEINTMPGFTIFSMYPKLWEATGLSYSELIDTLIRLAIERQQEKLQTRTDFPTQ